METQDQRRHPEGGRPGEDRGPSPEFAGHEERDPNHPQQAPEPGAGHHSDRSPEPAREPGVESAREPQPDRPARAVATAEPGTGGAPAGPGRAEGAEGNRQVEASREDAEAESAGLLPYHEADGYKRRWESLQTSFVDDPQGCCEQADALVIEVLDRMSQIRQEHRARLRGALDQGGADTEGLRQAMRQYRAFFSGLLRA